MSVPVWSSTWNSNPPKRLRPGIDAGAIDTMIAPGIASSLGSTRPTTAATSGRPPCVPRTASAGEHDPLVGRGAAETEPHDREDTEGCPAPPSGSSRPRRATCAGVLQRRAGRGLHDRQKVALVLFGHERPRHLGVDPVGQAEARGRTRTTSAHRDFMPALQEAHVAVGARRDPPLEEREEPVLVPWCSRSSSSAASAGVSVSALNADSATANAIVIANCA